MKRSPFPVHVTAVAALLAAGVALVVADGTRFSSVTPLPSSAGPTSDESMPITFGNPNFEQRSVIDRSTQLAAGAPNTGNFDMNTVNETGPSKSRYLFTVFETDQSGVQRQDRWTGETQTIWFSQQPLGAVAFDACYWTPWGTLITAEEAWETQPAGSTQPYGRLFELKNPIDAPGIYGPLTASSNDGAQMVHQNVIPRTSHEGILLDAGEGLARWASNGTPGSEFTGLYFDPTNKRRAWVNIQHPSSGNDRTIEITIPRGRDDGDDESDDDRR